LNPNIISDKKDTIIAIVRNSSGSAIAKSFKPDVLWKLDNTDLVDITTIDKV